MTSRDYGSRSGKINMQGYVDVRQIATFVKYLHGKDALFTTRFSDVQVLLFDIVLGNLERNQGVVLMEMEESLIYLDQMGFSLAQMKTKSGAVDYKGGGIRKARAIASIESEDFVPDRPMTDIERAVYEAARTGEAKRKNKKREAPLVSKEQEEAMGYALTSEKDMPTKEFAVVSQSEEGERIVRSALPPGFDPEDIMTKADTGPLPRNEETKGETDD